MLDIHTHILPGMDDGSKSVEQSLSMLKCEWEQGIESVALTPHFYADRESPERFLRRRASSMAALIQAIQDETEIPDLYAGAEVAYYPGISHTEEIDALCIGRTRVMLLEMPFCKWNQRMIDEVHELQNLRGIQPVLAHVERYMAFQSDDVLWRLCGDGVWLQANASFFQRWQTSRKAMQMLDDGLIHFIGSDCHNMETRKPEMGNAIDRIEKKLGDEPFRFLTHMEKMLFGGA